MYPTPFIVSTLFSLLNMLSELFLRQMKKEIYEHLFSLTIIFLLTAFNPALKTIYIGS